MLDKYSADEISRHLRDAGYEIVNFDRAKYTIDGRQYLDPPFFIAKAPAPNA